MKKIILLFALFMCALSVKAQFTLTAGGFVSSEDETKDYVVIPFEGKTQQELYIAVRGFIMAAYNSPRTVLSENLPASLSVMGAEDFHWTMLTNRFSYKILVEMKDGRVRIVPSMVSFRTEDSGADVLLFSKGKPRKVMKSHIEFAESIINGFVNGLKGCFDSEAEEW